MVSLYFICLFFVLIYGNEITTKQPSTDGNFIAVPEELYNILILDLKESRQRPTAVQADATVLQQRVNELEKKVNTLESRENQCSTSAIEERLFALNDKFQTWEKVRTKLIDHFHRILIIQNRLIQLETVKDSINDGMIEIKSAIYGLQEDLTRLEKRHDTSFENISNALGNIQDNVEQEVYQAKANISASVSSLETKMNSQIQNMSNMKDERDSYVDRTIGQIKDNIALSTEKQKRYFQNVSDSMEGKQEQMERLQASVVGISTTVNEVKTKFGLLSEELKNSVANVKRIARGAAHDVATLRERLLSEEDTGCGLPVAFFVKNSQRARPRGPGTLKYDTKVTDTCNTFDMQTGKFTCPKRGVYVFHSFALNNADNVVYMQFYKNDQIVIRMHADDQGSHETAGNTVILELEKGDQIYIYIKSAYSFVLHEEYNTFSGYMLS